jgi:hypothetical protein
VMKERKARFFFFLALLFINVIPSLRNSRGEEDERTSR